MCLVLNDEQKAQILRVAYAAQKKTEPGIYYRYVGPAPQRDFCKEMIRLDKLYSKKEIDFMSFKGVNKSFGHKGKNYSIYKYRGGINCQHVWNKIELKKDKKGKLYEVDLGPVSTEPVGPYPVKMSEETNLLTILRKLNQI